MTCTIAESAQVALFYDRLGAVDDFVGNEYGGVLGVGHGSVDADGP